MKKRHKIIRRKLSDEVFDQLIEIIENDGYKPGDKFPSERELMEDFGVGRPSIREAMQALEKIGLITIGHGERARVSTPTANRILEQIDLPARRMLSTSSENLDDLIEARIFFEIGMARIAAEKATAKDIDKLRKELKRQTEAYGKSSSQFIEADISFHGIIASISGNGIFKATGKAMLSWFLTFHKTSLHWEGREKTTLEEHGKIIEQIAAHDLDGAGKAIEIHLKRLRR